MLASRKHQLSWVPELNPSIQLFLEKREYTDAAEKLFEAHQLANQNGEPGLANLLLEAHQMCLTCDQQQQNVQTYYEIYENARFKEEESRKQLDGLLSGIMDGETAVYPYTFKTQPQFQPKSPSLWKRVQNVLTGRGNDKKGEERPLFQPNPPPDTQIPTATSLLPEPMPPLPTPVQPTPSLPTLAQPPLPTEASPYPTLTIYCLGTFRIYEDDHPIDNWSNGKGKSIFKYLMLHRQQPVNKETLMDMFWPNASHEAARNNLNVAIYGLRQTLRNGYPDFSHVLFQNNSYLLNPDLHIWVDIEVFQKCLKTAQELETHNQMQQALAQYHAAESLYLGELLTEDRYEDWLLPQREKLKNNYLSILDWLSQYYFAQQDLNSAISYCQKTLNIDACREETHRQLMHAYYKRHQHYLAIRQYHQCIESLKTELDVPPDPITTQLYESIRRHEPIL